MDLICFSHLRWNFVYQRPQHLMTQATKSYRVYFFEEPVLTSEVDHYEQNVTQDKVNVVTPFLQEESPVPVSMRLKKLLAQLMNSEDITNYIFWYYTPLMLDFSSTFHPSLIVYDCMDQLSAFKNASPFLESAEAELLKNANVVFTGGMSLFSSKKDRHSNVSCFPSSIDYVHFSKARNDLPDFSDQQNIPYPRLGFYGVIDERFDSDLLKTASEIRPDFHFVIIGPVVKINPETLPKAPNIHYLGIKKYEDLPNYISNWDIALLLFAINESTRFISPTKTPEYLAAGLPVISTPVEDVITTYGDTGLVSIIKDAKQLVDVADSYLSIKDHSNRINLVDSFISTLSWDKTWNSMNEKIIRELNDKQTKKKLLHV